MFVESLISGFANALAYAVVMVVLTAVLFFAARKLGPLVYQRMMGQMLETFTLVMRSPISQPNPPVANCPSCEAEIMPSFPYCPFCGNEVHQTLDLSSMGYRSSQPGDQ